MANSFYGGKQGFSFVLRGNPNADDHLFHNEAQVRAAVNQQLLKYGEYAYISSPDEDHTDQLGNLYRILQGNAIELVAKITGPQGEPGIGIPGPQGPKGEDGKDGEPGKGFIYTEHEADMYVPTSTTITLDMVETAANLKVHDDLITVGIEDENAEIKGAVGTTQDIIMETNSQLVDNPALLSTVWSRSSGIYYYDISKLYTIDEDSPVLAIYEGGQLPPLIYFRGISVKQGEALNDIPAGLYMIIKYHDVQMLWPILICAGLATGSTFAQAADIPSAGNSQINKIKMIQGKRVYNNFPCFTILGKCKNDSIVGGAFYYCGDRSVSAPSSNGGGGNPAYVNGVMPQGYSTVTEYLPFKAIGDQKFYTVEGHNSSETLTIGYCIDAFNAWLGGAPGIRIATDESGSLIQPT